ncbi:MAG: hypothetical protein U0414_02035 [Polyangiaceae bacterium]
MPIAAPHRATQIARALAAAAVVLPTPGALAEPQVNAGLTVGVAGRGFLREPWEETEFHLGLRGDVLFGRNNERQFGVGPYVEALTDGFDEFQFGGGASLLLPVIDSLPIVASFGAYGRIGAEGFGLEPGIATSLFFGSRSYNFNSNYVMAFGVLPEFRYGLGDSREMTFIVALHLDLAFFSLPIVYLADAIRGGSPETDRVPPKQPPDAKKTGSWIAPHY